MEILYNIFIDPFVEMVQLPDFFVQVVWEGLVAGILYSLIALGFVLIFKASGIFNFAQGVMALFAALTLVGLMEKFGFPTWLAIIGTIGVMILLAWLIERLMLRHLVNQEPIILFMATIGLAYFLEGLGDLMWGADIKPMEVGLPSGGSFWWEDVTRTWAPADASPRGPAPRSVSSPERSIW